MEAKLTEFDNSFDGTMKKEKFMIEIVSLRKKKIFFRRSNFIAKAVKKKLEQIYIVYVPGCDNLHMEF